MKYSEIMIYFLCAILLVSAFVLCSGGLYLVVGFKHMNDNILPKFDDAKAKIRKMIETINIYPGNPIDDPPNVTNSSPLEDIHFDRIVNGLGYYVLGLSLIMMIVGFTTITGTCKKSKCFWKTCIMVTLALLVTETITLLLGTCFKSIVKDFIKTYFQEQLNFSFQSLRSKDSVSIGWNLLMQKFNCCGIDGYFDFNASSSFDEIWGEPFHTFMGHTLFKTALACCDTIYLKPTPPKDYGPCDDTEYVTKQGCMDVLWNEVEEYKVFFIGFLAFIMIIQVLNTVLVFVKLHKRRKSNRIGGISNTSKNCNSKSEMVKRNSKKEITDSANIGDYKHNDVNEERFWVAGFNQDLCDIKESISNENNIHDGSSATHTKEKSWLHDFNRHLQSSEQTTHYIEENAWLQDFQRQLQGLDQKTRIDNDGADLKEEKWYNGIRNQPMQRPRRT